MELSGGAGEDKGELSWILVWGPPRVLEGRQADSFLLAHGGVYACVCVNTRSRTLP